MWTQSFGCDVATTEGEGSEFFMNGRAEEREGTALRRCPGFFFFFSLFFVNGRAEQLRTAEMRRLHFYEWGGLRMALRRRDAEIFFMNG